MLSFVFCCFLMLVLFVWFLVSVSLLFVIYCSVFVSSMSFSSFFLYGKLWVGCWFYFCHIVLISCLN